MSRSAVLAALGFYLPPATRTNQDLSAVLDTTPEWIERRTGIQMRHVVAGAHSTSDLAVEAGRRALTSIDNFQVDAVVLATTSPDRLCPATAPEIAHRLGCGNVAAFDLAAVCSGFLYGLGVSAGLIASGTCDRVLLVGAEAFSTLINPEDRSTAVIFGDGAGAVVLRSGAPEELGAFGPFCLASDGAGSDLIEIRAGGSRQRARCGLGHESIPKDDWYVRMDGNEVYRHAIARMVESSRAALTQVGWEIADVDWFVGHQANSRILHAVARRLGLDVGKVVINLDVVGNTAAASIPLALASAAASGALHSGHRVLLAAFGGGLSWGATVLEWPNIPVAHL